MAATVAAVEVEERVADGDSDTVDVGMTGPRKMESFGGVYYDFYACSALTNDNRD